MDNSLVQLVDLQQATNICFYRDCQHFNLLKKLVENPKSNCLVARAVNQFSLSVCNACFLMEINA